MSLPAHTARRVCGCCLKAGWQGPQNCVYCGMVLSTRHEHDHMPVPFRAGGKDTVPVCVNCHDLKDRVNPADWDQAEVLAAIEGSPPIAKILIVKLLGDLHAAEEAA